MRIFENSLGFFVRQLIHGLFPVQPHMAAMLVRKRYADTLGFSKIPVHLLCALFPFVPIRVFASFDKIGYEFYFRYAGFFLQLPSRSRKMVFIGLLDVPLREIPVPLGVLEQKYGSVVDQNNATRGLHGQSREAIGQVNFGEMVSDNLLEQRAHACRYASSDIAVRRSRSS